MSRIESDQQMIRSLLRDIYHATTVAPWIGIYYLSTSGRPYPVRFDSRDMPALFQDTKCKQNVRRYEWLVECRRNRSTSVTVKIRLYKADFYVNRDDDILNFYVSSTIRPCKIKLIGAEWPTPTEMMTMAPVGEIKIGGMKVQGP